MKSLVLLTLGGLNLSLGEFGYLLFLISGVVVSIYLTHYFVNLFFEDIIAGMIGKKKAKQQKVITIIVMYAVMITGITIGLIVI